MLAVVIKVPSEFLASHMISPGSVRILGEAVSSLEISSWGGVTSLLVSGKVKVKVGAGSALDEQLTMNSVCSLFRGSK